jgi:hypothetical protein
MTAFGWKILSRPAAKDTRRVQVNNAVRQDNTMFRGHPIDTIILEREIYFLAVLFNASESLFRASDVAKEDEIDRLRAHFETSEASRALVSVAVMLRSQMDCMSDEQITLLASDTFRIVGAYLAPKQGELDFREACNKIIHLREIKFDLQEASFTKAGFLLPWVQLSGEYRDEEWTVKIDINHFVKVAFALS